MEDYSNKKVSINKKLFFYMLMWAFFLWPILFFSTTSIFRVSTKAIGFEGFFWYPFVAILIIISIITLIVLYKKLYKAYVNYKLKINLFAVLAVLLIVFFAYFVYFDDPVYATFPKEAFGEYYFLIKRIVNAFFIALLFTSFSFINFLLTQKSFIRKASKKGDSIEILEKNIYHISLKMAITLFVVFLLSVMYINFNIYKGPSCEDNSRKDDTALAFFELNCNLHGGEYVCDGFHTFCGFNKTSDGGKSCTSSDQCEGLCIEHGYQLVETKCSDYMPPVVNPQRVIERRR